ncbi:acyl-CoA thioesterase [Alicyclobacillus dauci]|uniref:Acyl-CoA thioesterase n=1 Tax=Alicyclobacillus dauci TaxID=1475485 RepID=A0ABY6Z115_9BACL|nr:thioesterase family protein [Alicyclobacillus dauci]WAH36283.1 acyl-CoA thioesterase [Alicyclobacillus dauci]
MATVVTKDRVAFADTDASGRIHFMLAMRYFEIGEREALRVLGIKAGDPSRGGYEIPRVHIECNYHHALYYDDEIDIHATCSVIKTSSLTWDIKVYCREELCISGNMVTVLLDPETHESMKVPEDWREKLLA